MFLISAALMLAIQTAPIPDKVMLTVPPGKCRILVDDVEVSDAEFLRMARPWKASRPQIHFQPYPDTEYDCVDHALRLVKKAKLTRLGFIGNEQLPEKPQ
jgi:hypothetical protein